MAGVTPADITLTLSRRAASSRRAAAASARGPWPHSLASMPLAALPWEKPMPLRECLECGHAMSDSARSCPSCHSKTPFGVPCELCWATIRPTDGASTTRSYYSDGGVTVSVYAHRACIDRAFTPSASLACRDCRRLIRGMGHKVDALSLWDSYARFDCPACGAVDLLRVDRFEWRPPCSCHAPRYIFQLPPHGAGHGHPQDTSRNKGCAFLLISLSIAVIAEGARVLCV